MSRLRAKAVAALAVICLFGLSACASIQDQSQPVPVSNPPRGDAGLTVGGPEPGTNQWRLVRQFIKANAQSAGDYKVARQFLSADERRAWNPHTRVTVVADDVATAPDPDEGSGAPHEQSLLVRGTAIGTLNPDGSFTAAQSDQQDYQQRVTVARNKDREWRIKHVSDGLIVRLSDFQRAYQQVTLYFMEPRLQAPIPDVRYLPRGPAGRVATKIVNGLIAGPSKTLRAAVSNNFAAVSSSRPAKVDAKNPESVKVDLTPIKSDSETRRNGMIDQIVRSLRGVVGDRLEIRSNGKPLVAGKRSVRYSDLASFSLFTPSPNAVPLYVGGGELRALPAFGQPSSVSDQNDQLEAMSGVADCQAESAARSLDGEQLAVTCTGRDRRQHLRIGEFGKTASEVRKVAARRLTRPTWTVGSPQSQVGYEAWTVADGHKVERLHRDGKRWRATKVDTGQLRKRFGKDSHISKLRLSRDGVRAALIVNGKLVICTVQREADGDVQLVHPLQIGGKLGDTVSDVDWASRSRLVAVSGEAKDQLSTVSADGLYANQVDTTNMTAPIEHIAAAPGQPYIAVANGTTFTSSSNGDSWIPVSEVPKGADPFYAG